MWFIPFVLRFFPKLRFLHLVRDGRDMALSKNRFFLRTHGNRLIGPHWREDPITAQIDAWRLGNRRAFEFATEQLGDRYLFIRYEDICHRTRDTVERILRFLGALDDGEMAEELAHSIRPSPGIGRWRKSGLPMMAKLTDRARKDLELFGYPTE